VSSPSEPPAPRRRQNPRKEWCPIKAIILPTYPATKERFEELRAVTVERIKRQIAEGNWHRRGVPNGWKGRKAEAEALRTAAAHEAKKIVAQMTAETNTDDPRAIEALEYAVTVIRAKDADGKTVEGTRERLSAAKLVLDFTKSKPATTVNATVTKAEDFLAALAAKV
jgi:hypothetical protein